jgi:integrase
MEWSGRAPAPLARACAICETPRPWRRRCAMRLRPRAFLTHSEGLELIARWPAYAEWLAEVERRIAAPPTDRPEEPITSPLVRLEGAEGAALESPPNSPVELYADVSRANGSIALFDEESKPLKVFEAYWQRGPVWPDPPRRVGGRSWPRSHQRPCRALKVLNAGWYPRVRRQFRKDGARRLPHRVQDGLRTGGAARTRVKQRVRRLRGRGSRTGHHPREGRAFTDAQALSVLNQDRQVPMRPIGAGGWAWAACCRWVPWLLAYTGARAGEMTQLRARDVERRLGPSGCPEGDARAGTVKTGCARTVPLHAELVRQGFRQFAQHALAVLGRMGRCSSSRPKSRAATSNTDCRLQRHGSAWPLGYGAWALTTLASRPTTHGDTSSRPAVPGLRRASETPSVGTRRGPPRTWRRRCPSFRGTRSRGVRCPP